tara:strand:- start:2923 stop:3552 length:630 start_codon:yes stop_codon:yes gene_type:complete
MKRKPNYFAIIPANVRYDHELCPNAKLLYAEISALYNMNGKCTAPTSYFADLYQVSKVSIQKWLKLLETKKYIKRAIIYKEDSKQIEMRYISIVNYPNKDYLTTPSKEILTDNNNNISNNNITYSNKERFKKPTVEEIVLYCVEKNYNVIAIQFFDYYESKGWMIGKNKMKDWKAAIRNWHRRNGESKIQRQLNTYNKAKEMIKKINNK